MRNHEKILNEIAQGLMEFRAGVNWFSDLSESERGEVLHELALYCSQAHPTVEESREAVKAAGVKVTVNPAVMIVREPVVQQLGKIANLPPEEHLKSFRVLAAVFKISDTRRREVDCKGGCGHPWHNLA